ncbi:unnamed protein product, partial [Staurois parvus]
MCLCFTASTLLCMAVLCTAMQSSVRELTGRRTALFLNSSSSRRSSLAITGHQRIITGWDRVIDSHSFEWRH